MSAYQQPKSGLTRVFAAGGLLLLGACGLAAAAERPSESQILRALRAPPIARSMSGEPAPADVKRQNFINTVRKSRSLTDDQRSELATIAKDRPSIDLEIFFDYNSAEITSRAEPDLTTLGRALSGAELKGGVYLIGGHTDAKGGDEYNQRLSERRAQSVKDYLIRRFQITEDTLVTAGYGEEQLKNKSDPYAAENRRVQIINLETKHEATK